MVDEAKLEEQVEKMRNLIRIGRERIAGHSPVWAAYLAAETLRSLADVIDEIDGDLHTEGGSARRSPLRRAV